MYTFAADAAGFDPDLAEGNATPLAETISD